MSDHIAYKTYEPLQEACGVRGSEKGPRRGYTVTLSRNPHEACIMISDLRQHKNEHVPKYRYRSRHWRSPKLVTLDTLLVQLGRLLCWFQSTILALRMGQAFLTILAEYVPTRRAYSQTVEQNFEKASCRVFAKQAMRHAET